MQFLMLANHLIMLAGGIDGDKRPLSGSERWGVTLVGLGVVIAALAILVGVITLFGKIFESVNANQKAKAEAAAEQKKAKAAAAPAPAPVSAPAKAPVKPVSPAPVQATASTANTDDDEVIAVISAVVAMMSEADGTVYQVKSVKPASGGGFSGRSAWAMDGRRQNVNHTF